MLTRTVRDTAAALDVISTPMPGDPFSAPSARTSFLAACDHEVPRLRIGVLTEPVIAEADVHPACLDAVAQTVTALEAMGHVVEPTTAPFGAQEWASFQCVWEVGAASIPLPEGCERNAMPMTRWLRKEGRRRTGVELAEGLAGIQMISRTVGRHWADYDLIVSPTLAQPPLPHGQLHDDDDPAADFAAQCRFTPWTSLWNITGRPAMSLPLHTSIIDGMELPIGVMIGGPMYSEERLLALGCALLGR